MKVNIIPFFGIPIAAVICLHPDGKVDVRRQTIWLVTALGTVLILSGMFVVGMRLVGQDVLTRSLFLALSGEGTSAKYSVIDLQRILNNILWTYRLISDYLGWGTVAVLLAAVLSLIVRRQFFLVLCVFGPMLATWISVTQESRFLVLPLALLFLAGAVGLGMALNKSSRIVQVVAVGLIVVWAVMQWLPFTVMATNNPNDIPLPNIDVQQYVRSSAAGTGYPETIKFLQSAKVDAVIGLTMNCQGLRYLALNQHQTYTVECPVINLNGTNIDYLRNVVNANRRAGVFVVTEKAEYVPQDIPGQQVAVIDKPHNGVKIYIYQLLAP